MTVRVLLFAALREAAGARELTVELPDGADLAGLRAAVGAARPALRPYLETAAVAVNEEYAGPDTRLHPGDVAALIPPVSGG
jgi:molybdopterin converting factor subunit 1